MIRTSSVILIMSAFFMTAKGQTSTGSATITIDPGTLMVTGTCETALDTASEGYYDPSVTCVLTDAAGHTLGSSTVSDNQGAYSVSAVVQVQGVAGTSYLLTSTSDLHPFVIDDEPSQGRIVQYQVDEYNFESFIETGETDTYPLSNTWDGPGPETDTRRQTFAIGSTTATAAIAPTITYKFSGTKSTGDNLTFAAGGGCAETLGPLYAHLKHISKPCGS